MKRLGVLLLLALTACGEAEPTYADGEEVANVLKCESPDTIETVAGPDTTCTLDGADVTITEWQTTDDMRSMHIDNWEQADYASVDIGRDFTVFVPEDEVAAVEAVRTRLG